MKREPRLPHRLGLLLLALAAAWPAVARDDAPSTRRRLERDILHQLIGIDSTHAAGSTRLAQVLRGRLLSEGYAPADVLFFEPQPGKGNLVVRLHGSGRAPPVLYLAHLDVVEARPEDWSVPPFQLTERDGDYLGRGVVDMKGEVASLVANLIRLRREQYRPARDLVVAFTSDEESGGTLSGAEWLLAEHRDLVTAGLVVNPDGGGGEIVGGARSSLRLQTGEKVYASFRFEATSPGGHSSLPVPGNAVYRLAAAVERLGRYEFPPRLDATTREYFRRLAAGAEGQRAEDLRRVGASELDPVAVARLAEEPLYNATLRTTCVATLLAAGHAEAALAQRATATVQCRLLPAETVEATLARLREVVADPTVEVSVLGTPVPSPPSPLDAALLRRVEQVAQGLWPRVPVLPVMDPGSTDSYYFRLAGIPSYGISGMFTAAGANGVHGRDERIGVEAFHEGVEFDYRLMKALTR